MTDIYKDYRKQMNYFLESFIEFDEVQTEESIRNHVTEINKLFEFESCLQSILKFEEEEFESCLTSWLDADSHPGFAAEPVHCFVSMSAIKQNWGMKLKHI